jgi:hypothetical protein
MPRAWATGLAVVVGLLAQALLGPAPAAAQGRGGGGNGVPIAELLAAGFEIKGAVLAGILLQNGPLAYICLSPDRNRPVEWNCLPLHR